MGPENEGGPFGTATLLLLLSFPSLRMDSVTRGPGYRSPGSAAGPDPTQTQTPINPTNNDPGKSRARWAATGGEGGKWKGGGRGEQVG